MLPACLQIRTFFVIKLNLYSLTCTTLRTNSVEDKLMIFFLFFPEIRT